jgi:prefoldin subunit 5
MSTATDSLRLGIDADAASPVFDIADVPLYVNLLGAAGIAFRDHRLDVQVNDEFQKLQASVSDAIQNEKTGYLIEASLFIGPGGEPVIPGGQILYPVGLGMEPIDSLAEHMRYPELRGEAPNPGMYRDNSFYYWIGKKDGKLLARTVPREFRDRLRDLANAERDRREILGDYVRSFPHEAFKTLEVADFWLNVYKSRAAALRSEANRKRVDELNQQMQALQGEFNGLYKHYQELQQEIARCQEYQATLSKIDAIASLVQNGIKAGALFSSDGKAAVGSDLKSPLKADATAEWVERRIDISGENATILEKRINVIFLKLKDGDDAIVKQYGDSNIPLPKREPLRNPVVPRP